VANTLHRLEIRRHHRIKEGLSFTLDFDQQKTRDAHRSITLTYSEFQKLLQFGKEFMSSCMARKSTHEWETTDE
jgi:hypothetical protein